MTFARVKLVVAALAFAAWLAWLAVAVANKGTVQIVSPGQLTDATHLAVVAVTANDSGDVRTTASIVRVLRAPAHDPISGEIDIDRLDKAVTPLPVNGSRRVAAGEHFVPLVKTPFGFRIAGLPRSPGFEGATLEFPVVYPWTDDVKAQLRTLGILND
jgi:hypothetical protein